MTPEIQMFGLLVFGHALADYPLQGDFLSRAKNHTAPITGVPWYQALAAHCVIHAGFVGLITGSMTLAIAELIVHAIIDHAKCSGRFGFNADQTLHVIFKAVWVFYVVQVLP